MEGSNDREDPQEPREPRPSDESVWVVPEDAPPAPPGGGAPAGESPGLEPPDEPPAGEAVGTPAPPWAPPAWSPPAWSPPAPEPDPTAQTFPWGPPGWRVGDAPTGQNQAAGDAFPPSPPAGGAAPPAGGYLPPAGAPGAGYPPGGYGPPPSSFGSPYGGQGGGPLPPPGPRHRRHLGIWVVLAALVVLAGGLGGGIAIALDNSQSTTATSPSSSAAPVSSSSLNTAAIAARVDPAIVDITSTLGYQRDQAAGTGMVITSSGEVLTNNHVIEGATSLSASIAGTSKNYKAKVIGADPTADVALIQLEGASGLPTVSLGDSSKVSVGDPVVAIGNALDLPGAPTVTEGTVSALNRSITAGDSNGANTEQLTGLIQTDAPLEPGNSGGPLTNASGQVIGMNTAAASGAGSTQQTSSNVGFAIPVNTARSIAQQIQSGSPSSPSIRMGAPAFLGVQVQAAGSGSGAGSGAGGFGGGFGGIFGGGSQGNAPVTSGAMVVQVEPNTPAQSIGLQAGDAIVSFDGKTISSPSDLSKAIAPLKPGATVSIGWVDTSGQHHSTTVQLASGPAA